MLHLQKDILAMLFVHNAEIYFSVFNSPIDFATIITDVFESTPHQYYVDLILSNKHS